MKIERVDVVPFEADYPAGGYAMSHVHLTRHVGRLVRLTTESGAFGYGEIVRKPVAAPDKAAAVEDRLLPDLQGLALNELLGLFQDWRDMDDPASPERIGLTLASGVELAFLDLISREAGLPLSTLLGGAAAQEVAAYNSISAGAPDDMARQVRDRPDHLVVQAKLGVDDIETDLRRVEAVLAAMRPDQTLLADFNGGLDLDTARRALPALEDPRLTWEDPCLSYDDNTELARALAQPVMLDMCMNGVGMFLRAIRDGVAGSLVIKPPFVGGLSAARTARDLCVAAGIPFRIDGPWSGPLAAAGSLHLAMGAPASALICSADLTDPFDLPDTLITHPSSGAVSVTPGPGLGNLVPRIYETYQ